MTKSRMQIMTARVLPVSSHFKRQLHDIGRMRFALDPMNLFGPFLKGFIGSVLCSILISIAVGNARAQSLEPPARKKVIVISPEEDVDEMKHLTEVAASHFRDLNAEVSLETASWKPKDVVAQVETARRLAAATGAFSVIWVEKSSEEIFLFVSDKTSQRVFVQTFEGSGDDWEAECETIAALVRSALITWLEVIPKNPDENKDVAANDDSRTPNKASPSADHPESPPKEKLKETAVKRKGTEAEPKPKKQKEIAIGRFDAGFAAKMVHRDEPWTYNGRFGAQLLLFETASIGFGAQAGSSLSFEIANDDVRLHHFPFYIELGIWHAFKNVELGTSLSGILDVSYLEENSQFREGSTRRRLGMGVLFSAAYRVLPIMSLSLFVGADFYFKTARYNYEGQPVLLFGPTQPYLGFGLAFYTKAKRAPAR